MMQELITLARLEGIKEFAGSIFFVLIVVVVELLHLGHR